jgi:hypothetical protein
VDGQAALDSMSDERPEDEEQEPATQLPNAGDAQSVSRAQTEARHRQEQVADFWKRCLNDPVGRMVFWGLLTDCHTFEERFATTPVGTAYPEAAWFAAGEREVGQRMWRTWVGVDPEAVMKMHQESDHLALRRTAAPRRRR